MREKNISEKMKMAEKVSVSHYKFIPRHPGTARTIQEIYGEYGSWVSASCPTGAVDAMQNRDGSQRIVFYENGSIYFAGEENRGPFHRKEDLKNDKEHIVVSDAATPTCAELNFKYITVGSDEVGTGDRFKQIIVTAVAVKPEYMEGLIRMNVTDSKQMKKNHLMQVGEILSGISQQEAREIFENGDTSIASCEEGFVEFRSRILPNSTYDKFIRTDNGRDKNDLLSELHAQVLNSLTQSCKPDYVVVDDFMETDNKVRKEFYQMLDMEKERIFLRTKADAVNMAVSCASVISAYFSEIYMEWRLL